MAPFHLSKIPQKNSPLPLPFTLHLKSPSLGLLPYPPPLPPPLTFVEVCGLKNNVYPIIRSRQSILLAIDNILPPRDLVSINNRPGEGGGRAFSSRRKNNKNYDIIENG